MELGSKANNLFWVSFIMTLFASMIALSDLVTFRRLKAWAKQQGVRVLKRSLRRSYDFYVTVEDPQKNIFTGWVQTGGLIAALFSKRPIVIWDNRPRYQKE